MDEIKTKKTHSLFPWPDDRRCTSQGVTIWRQPGGSDKAGCLTLEMLHRGRDCSVQAEVWCELMAFASAAGLGAELGLSTIPTASDALCFWCSVLSKQH